MSCEYNNANLTNLCTDLKIYVCSFLDVTSLINIIRPTCHLFKNLSSNPLLWNKITCIFSYDDVDGVTFKSTSSNVIYCKIGLDATLNYNKDQMINFFKQNPTTSFEISDNDIDFKDMRRDSFYKIDQLDIIELLQDNILVKCLSIYYKFNHNMIERLNYLISKGKIHTLYLKYVTFDNYVSSISFILHFPLMNINYLKLDVSDESYVSPEFMKSFGNALATNTTIRTLYLEYFENQYIPYIVTGLRENRTIDNLILTNAYDSTYRKIYYVEFDIEQFAKIFETNNSLTSLSICNFGCNKIEPLTQILITNTSLTMLDLSGNCIGCETNEWGNHSVPDKRTSDKLNEMIQKNKTLKKINLLDNNISNLNDIINSYVNSKTLEEIHVNYLSLKKNM